MVNVLIVAVSLTLGQAETGNADSLQTQVDRLVRQLNDDELAERQAAERELVKLGVGVLERLPSTDGRMPQEMKSRLTRVRSQLEEAAAVAATQPSRITLKGEMPLSEILAQLLQQSGNRVIDFRNQFGQPSSDPKIQVDFDQAPFWQVVDDIFDQIDMKVYAYSGQLHTLAFVGRDQGELPAKDRVAYNGLFRFEANQVQAIRNLRVPDTSSLALTLEIAWEPRILPIVVTHPLENIAAQAENGEAIVVDNAQGVLETSIQNTVSSVEIDVRFELPSRNVSRIASLKGEIAALMPGREATFTFEDLNARDAEQRTAGVAVTLQRVRKNADVHQVLILVRFDKASGALESHRGWIYGNEAYALDADGNRVENASFETTRQQVDEIGLAYNFVLDGELEDYKFVYKTPAAIVSLPVQYELKNIDLP